jgi:hypothetical protein
VNTETTLMADRVIEVVNDGRAVQFIDAPRIIEVPQHVTVVLTGGDPVVPVSGIAGQAIFAGAVVRINKSTARVVLAQADHPNTAEPVGLARADAVNNGTVAIAQDRVTLPDWTAVTGVASLQPGHDYFLSTTTPGGLTATPPASTGQVSCWIGTAVSTTTLLISIQDPFQL